MSLNLFYFFFTDTATTEIYPLSLHDALPIYRSSLPLHNSHNSSLVQREPKYGSSRAFFLGKRKRLGKNRISDRKSIRLNSSHVAISYAVFCLKKKKKIKISIKKKC